jgi:hypothetical protein
MQRSLLRAQLFDQCCDALRNVLIGRRTRHPAAVFDFPIYLETLSTHCTRLLACNELALLVFPELGPVPKSLFPNETAKAHRNGR